MLAVDEHFDAIERVYERPDGAEQLTHRLSKWHGAADVPVILFCLLREVQALRAELAASRARSAEA